MTQIKVRRKYMCLFENAEQEELIYVWYEDLNGYIHYDYCKDLTMQIYTMTKVELVNNYTRVEGI